MSGWMAIALVALIAAAALVLLKLPRRLWEAAAAALMLGLAGYAWQGHPDVPGVEGRRIPAPAEEDATNRLLAIRSDMDQHFSTARSILVLADGFTRRGGHDTASALISGALERDPRSGDLWNALGLDMLIAADFRLTPAAQLAFARARNVQPSHPGPDYFLGLAALSAGNAQEAADRWDAVLARPGGTDSDWRRNLTEQRAALAAMMAESAAPGPAGAPTAPMPDAAR